MKVYRIIGKFKMGSNFVDFTKEMVSNSKDEAIEKILSDIGSQHRTKRKGIKIESIRELKIEEVDDLYVREMLEAEDGK